MKHILVACLLAVCLPAPAYALNKVARTMNATGGYITLTDETKGCPTKQWAAYAMAGNKRIQGCWYYDHAREVLMIKWPDVDVTLPYGLVGWEIVDEVDA